MSPELVRLLATSGTAHVGHIYDVGMETMAFTLCGLHMDLEIVYDETLDVDCKRCRNGVADDLRRQLENMAKLKIELGWTSDRIGFLERVLHKVVTT